MKFSTNYENIGEFEILPEGTYEMLITKCALEQDKQQRQRIQVQMVIRNDVTQNCQNRIMFHSLYRVKEPKPLDAQVDGFSFAMLMQIASAVALPSGKEYADLAALLADFVNRPVRVVVFHDTYNGNTQARVKFWNKTEFPVISHRMKANTPNQNSWQNPPAAQLTAEVPPMQPKMPWE